MPRKNTTLVTVGMIGVEMHAQRILLPTFNLVPEMHLVALASRAWDEVQSPDQQAGSPGV